jgi:tRNA (cmo5U34)-methyltransferase
MIRRTNFDLIAPLYDRLASIVFGNRIVRSQLCFLHTLSHAESVLVLGGGTGRFLPSLMRINRRCQIWYIDSSAEMIRRARQKVILPSRVHFIQGTEEDIPGEIKFDGVITFFFLDLFADEYLAALVEKISKSLRTDGLWLAADFVNKPRVWAQVMLKLMYFFFRWTCGIKARVLPDWQLQFSHFGEVLHRKFFYAGFIESCVFRVSRLKNPHVPSRSERKH